MFNITSLSPVLSAGNNVLHPIHDARTFVKADNCPTVECTTAFTRVCSPSMQHKEKIGSFVKKKEINVILLQ